MEQVIEKKKELPKEQIKTNEEKHFRILGITF